MQIPDTAPTITAGVLLARIEHWHRYAQVEREGEMWVVKTQADWAEDTGLSERQVRRSMATLREADLIETTRGPWGRALSVTHARPVATPGSARQRAERSARQRAERTARQRAVPLNRTQLDKDTMVANAQETADRFKKTSPEDVEAAAAAARQKPTSASLGRLWRAAYVLHVGFLSGLSEKERTGLGVLRRELGDELLVDLLPAVVEHWGAFMGRLRSDLGWSGDIGPAKPSLRFMAHLDRLPPLVAWHEDHAHTSAQDEDWTSAEELLA